MARTASRPIPTAARTLQPLGRHCPVCGETMRAAYHNYRTITTLDDVVHLTLQIRRCLNRRCPQFHRPYRPEAEGRLALPKHESLNLSQFVEDQNGPNTSTNSPLLALLAMAGSKAACKISSACSNAFC